MDNTERSADLLFGPSIEETFGGIEPADIMGVVREIDIAMANPLPTVPTPHLLPDAISKADSERAQSDAGIVPTSDALHELHTHIETLETLINGLNDKISSDAMQTTALTNKIAKQEATIKTLSESIVLNSKQSSADLDSVVQDMNKKIDGLGVYINSLEKRIQILTIRPVEKKGKEPMIAPKDHSDTSERELDTSVASDGDPVQTLEDIAYEDSLARAQILHRDSSSLSHSQLEKFESRSILEEEASNADKDIGGGVGTMWDNLDI